MAVVVCEHCQLPLKNVHQVEYSGYGYHKNCRKCYVCDETDLQGAEVFKGVIFCSSCSSRIFQGACNVRNTKQPYRKNKVRRRCSPKPRGKPGRKASPQSIIVLSELITSSDSSKQCSDHSTKATKNSYSPRKSIVMPTEMAFASMKPKYANINNANTKNSAEIGMTTEATQQLLNELRCPVVTKYKKAAPVPLSLCNEPRKMKTECSDLRIAELGTSREIASMALRHKNEPPIIANTESPAKRKLSVSDPVINKISDSLNQNDEDWFDSAYSTLDNNFKSRWMERRIQSIIKIPFYAFKREILRKSSLVKDDMSVKDSLCVGKKIRNVFHRDYHTHQKRGLKRLYSTINRRQEYKLGWLNLVSNVFNYNTEIRHQKTCKHFRTSHSYRCMRAQAMKLAGPTKSELADIRKYLKHFIAPIFLRNIAITYCKKPAILMSQACGASVPPSLKS